MIDPVRPPSGHGGTIPVALARQLRDAGLRWDPADGDRFTIPDLGMDEEAFMVSEMVVEVRETPAGPVMAFNGTKEWALDEIMQHEVVWLPREAQLRHRLGAAFIGLHAVEGGLRCTVELEGEPVDHDAPTATEAYGRALRHLLLHG